MKITANPQDGCTAVAELTEPCEICGGELWVETVAGYDSINMREVIEYEPCGCEPVAHARGGIELEDV